MASRSSPGVARCRPVLYVEPSFSSSGKNDTLGPSSASLRAAERGDCRIAPWEAILGTD